jgi:hypothetical protein
VIGGIFGDHTRMKIVRVLMLCTVAALSACNRDTGTPEQPAPAVHAKAVPAAKKGPTVEQQTAGMVEAASQGKSQMPVQLKFDVLNRPALGQVLDIDVAVVPQIDASPAEIQIAGGDGLTVDASANLINLAAVEAGNVYRQRLKVIPTVEGVLVLSLTITMKHDDLTESRVFSIPLIVEH